MRNIATIARSAMQGAMLTDRAAFLAAAGFATRATPCFEVSAVDPAVPDCTKMYVYDVIGGWYLDACEFVQAVHAVTTPTIDLHINSPGGLVFDAVSMFEALASSPAVVNVYIDGIAASAASFLAMAADPVNAAIDADGVRIAKGGRMMLHDAEGYVGGNAGMLRMYADILDSLSADISGYYADRAGRTPTEWRAVMQANGDTGTWYTAADAVAAGLADGITGSEPVDPGEAPADRIAPSTAAIDRASQLVRARARVALEGVR